MIARACWVEKHIRCSGQFEMRTKLRSEMRPCTCGCHNTDGPEPTKEDIA